MPDHADIFADVLRIYQGSDGDATKGLYARLEQLGPVGIIALNLFRAQKNSERAKVYRGRGYKGAAYDRKQWAMGNLSRALGEHAQSLSISWGWGIDPTQPVHNTVLYVDLPTGQVSFHTDTRGAGPDYPGSWDGIPGQSPDRIIQWATRLLTASAPATIDG